MATLQERLAFAEEAYDAVLLGKAPVEVRDQNGEMIRYTPANPARLSAYIESLKNQLGQQSVAPPLGFCS